jgi:hypothetical protein
MVDATVMTQTDIALKSVENLKNVRAVKFAIQEFVIIIAITENVLTANFASRIYALMDAERIMTVPMNSHVVVENARIHA